MMVRIAIIGSLLVMLTAAAVVAVIFLSRPGGGPAPREIAATDPGAAEPARTAPVLPLPDPPRDMPLPPEPVFREPPDPVAPVSEVSPPPPLTEPAPPVPRRKPLAPMAVEPAIPAPTPLPPRVARPVEPELPVRQPDAPIARTEPVAPDRADRDRPGPTEGYQPWTPAADATGPVKSDPPPSYRPDSPAETAALPPPEPASPDVSVALPTPLPDAPAPLAAAPTPEPASPIVTAALPPLAPAAPDPGVLVAPRHPRPAGDTSGPRQASRYKSWTPSDRDVRDNRDKPRTPGRDLLASINPTLERVPCSVLTASVAGGTVELWGAVRNRPDLQQVKSTLMNMRGVTGVRATVRQMSRAQCELVNLFSPYISANRKLDQRISVRARTPEAQYEEYDNLVLDLGSPGRDGFVYVDYYALDGSVVHLIPSSALPANRMPAGSARRLGDRPANGEWMIGKPLGLEMIVALSSTTPLFTSRREEVESAEIYLLDLQTSLKRVGDGPGGRVVADIVFIKTMPIR